MPLFGDTKLPQNHRSRFQKTRKRYFKDLTLPGKSVFWPFFFCAVWATSSHFPPASLFGTACFHSLLDHVSRNIIILIIDIKNGYLERTYLLCVCLEKLLYFHGILYVSVRPFAIFSNILFDHVFQAHLLYSFIESWIDLVKAEVGTSKAWST